MVHNALQVACCRTVAAAGVKRKQLDRTPHTINTQTTHANKQSIAGEPSTGVHVADLSLSEIRTLRARQRFPFRDQSRNDL